MRLLDIMVQGAESKLSPLEVGSMARASKELAAAAMKEIVDRIGDAVGRKRETLRIPFPGLGALCFAAGAAKFSWEGSLAPRRAVSLRVCACVYIYAYCILHAAGTQ